MTKSWRSWVAVLAMVSADALAGVPTYEEHQLQARANFANAFNLPDGNFFANITAQVNDHAEVAFNITAMTGSLEKAVWFGKRGSGQIEFTSISDASVSNASLNNKGRVVFEQAFVPAPGLYFYDGPTDASGLETTQPFGTTFWSSPTVNDAGQIGFRANFAGRRAFVSYDGVSLTANHAVEVSLDPGSPYSFLFTPSFNNARQIAGKARLGPAGQVGNDRPDQILVFEADGSSVVIAEDADSDPDSPFTSFDNSVAMTDDGWVSFTANLVGGGRGVFVSDGSTVIEIATEDHPMVSDIEFFGSAVNRHRVVVFRGFDQNGLRSIFAGDGTALRRVVTEHDLLPSDLGPARVDQETASSPVFGGGVSINTCGDVAFNAGLAPPGNNQIEWGSGVYLAVATREANGDYNCDGDVDRRDVKEFADCASGPDGTVDPICAVFDFNGDGDADFADFAQLQLSFNIAD